MNGAQHGGAGAAAPGQDPGQGFDWGELVDGLAEARGSLAAVAGFVAERRGFVEDVESVERGLRRLRKRGTRDGGVWGIRVLQLFGLPSAVVDRVRWMGQYHSRFTDLPTSLGAELIRPWDRPPVSESPARVWVLLARLSVALRRKADAQVDGLLQQAAVLAPRAEAAAQVELALVQAFWWSRRQPDRLPEVLAQAEAGLAAVTGTDRANLHARWVDQVAYGLNRPRQGPADHAGAAALYRTIPADGPLFAQCRRANGLGWSLLRQGERAAAEREARRSVQAAGDLGSLRMRAMALNLLAAATAGAEAAQAQRRAQAIAARLEDEALRLRFDRRRQRAKRA